MKTLEIMISFESESGTTLSEQTSSNVLFSAVFQSIQVTSCLKSETFPHLLP